MDNTSEPKMIIWSNTLTEFHLPGQHDQKTHGGSGGSALDKTEREGGATLEPKSGRSVRRGYAVATGVPSKVVPKSEFTPSVYKEWLRKTQFGPKQKVGVWDDGEGNIWLDVAEVLSDRRSAVNLGRKRNEKAIYDLKKGGEGEISTGGTGNVGG